MSRSKIVRFRSGLSASLFLAVVAALSIGCAGTRIDSEQRADPRQVVRPSVVLGFPFSVSETEVVLDTFGPEFISGSGKTQDKLDEARTVSRLLAAETVEQLNERGIEARQGRHDETPPLDALILKGQFVTIDEGDQLKRMTIGFGAGSSKTQVRVQVYQMTEYGLRRIAAGEATASGSKMPGMAIPVAGGAAAGSAAASAAISGGMAIAREVKGAWSEDAARIAEEIAERVETFYRDQGWL
jgi:hypothetical protein